MNKKELWNEANQFVQDVREFGFAEALYHQVDRLKFPEVEVLDVHGDVVRRGLLKAFDENGYMITLRSPFGYSFDVGPSEKANFRTKDGREITPGLFNELIHA